MKRIFYYEMIYINICALYFIHCPSCVSIYLKYHLQLSAIETHILAYIIIEYVNQNKVQSLECANYLEGLLPHPNLFMRKKK